MDGHSHASVILEWALNEEHNYVPSLYGCSKCDETSTEPLSNGSVIKDHEHTKYVDGCFACKLPTLQLATGDANGALIANNWTNKKWDKELDLYRSARAQGIQPDGTTTAKVQQALDASDKAGTAYGS